MRGKRTHRILLGLIFCMTLSLAGMIGKPSVKAADQAERREEILTLSGILQDNQGNSILSGKYVTRGEFARVLVQVSPYAGEIKKTSQIQLFEDVPKNNKDSAYIRLAVSKGYMSGYTDGTFRPGKVITLKEAIYGILTELGYTPKDFAGGYTDARFEKYKELKLDKRIGLGQNSKLTVKACKNLVYNLLITKATDNTVYGTKINVPINQKGAVDYQKYITSTKKGPYLATGNWKSSLPFSIGRFQIYLNGKKSSASKVKEYSVYQYSKRLKKLWAYNKVVYGSFDEITPNKMEATQITISGQNYTVVNKSLMRKAFQKNSIKKGSQVALLLGAEDQAAYVLPVTAKVDSNYHIVYTCKELKKTWTYKKQVMGRVETMLPNRTAPTTITVGGESYTVGNQQLVKKALKKYKLEEGKLVVLLLGKEDKVDSVLPIHSTVAEKSWSKGMDLAHYEKNLNDQGHTDVLPENYDVVYYSKELKKLWFYNKRTYGLLDLITKTGTKSMDLTIDGQIYSVEDPKSMSKLIDKWGIQKGSLVVALFGQNQKLVSLLPVDSMVANTTWYTQLPFDLKEATCYLNGKQVEADKLVAEDVIYYSECLKKIWGFDQKKYGTVTAILPDLSSPTDIKIGAVSYSLKNLPAGKNQTTTLSQNAWGKYFAEQEINTGSRVEILFGYNGAVAAVLPVEQMQRTIAGYVLSCGNEMVSDAQTGNQIKKSIKIVDTQGSVRDIECSDATITAGMIVEVSYSFGKPVIKRIEHSGLIDWTIKRTYAPQANVLAVHEVQGSATYEVLGKNQYGGIVLGVENVAYIRTNEQGQITDLILKNTDNKFYQYVLIKDVKYPDDYKTNGGVESYSINAIIERDGKEDSVSLDTGMSNVGVGPRRFTIEISKTTGKEEITAVDKLSEISIDAIKGMAVSAGTQQTFLADNAVIYFYDVTGYFQTSLEKVTDLSQYKLTGYLDKPIVEGGQVVVLVARKK